MSVVCGCLSKWLWSYQPFIRTSRQNKGRWHFPLAYLMHFIAPTNQNEEVVEKGEKLKEAEARQSQ